MSQIVNDNFEILTQLPVDNRYNQSDITQRDSIPETVRFEGLQCYVSQTQVLYALIGGIENTDWQPINGAVGVGSVATYLVEGYPFIWQKGRVGTTINGNNQMEVNDTIKTGWCDYDGGSGLENTLINTAIYVGGDTTLITSYNVLEYYSFT